VPPKMAARAAGRSPYGARVSPLHTRLAPDVHLEHLRAESARFRDVLAGCAPSARVPACPDWDAADLLWHLATVQRWWAEVLAARPARPEEVEPPRPAAYGDLLAAYDRWSRDLAEVLAEADPRDEAWNWSDDHTVGFILRRQAHEALVHRVDAEQAAGLSSEIDPLLASDGVHECLDVMYGGMPPWGSWEPGEGLVRVDLTDTGEEFWLRFGTFSGTSPESGTTYADEEDFHVVEPPADGVEPDVVVDGPAAALDLWLWNRGDDTHLSVAGDRGVLGRFTAIVASPID
jgi:uncharacterized protein (TIGR03083 family)